MHITQKLKKPFILHDIQHIHHPETKALLENHPFVFMQKNNEIYAIKTFALLAQMKHHPLEAESFQQLLMTEPLALVPYEELNTKMLDILSEEVTLIAYQNEITYISREEFLLSLISDGDTSSTNWLHNLFSSIPKGLMVVNLDYVIVNCNAEATRMLRIPIDKLLGTPLDKILGLLPFQEVQFTQISLLNQVITLPDSQVTILIDFVPLIENNLMTGYALVLQDLPSVERMAMELDSIKDLNKDLEAILSTIYDEIIVVDANGTLLRASTHYIPTQWNLPPQEQIGQQIDQIQTHHHLLYQVLNKVKKSKSKISLMQIEGDSPLIAVGNPILSTNGKLDRVVIASRDLTEMARLQRELERTRKQSTTYQKKIEELQNKIPQFGDKTPIFASASMLEIMKEVQQIAQFSATVMVTGESGVGKEVIADAIHALSPRRNNPIIKINCASIPDTLLESELFGYVKGAFSGAKPEGKLGLFIKADKGTLFLDEISELPINIQSKLLRAIQEREVYPVGATTPVKFDVQLIAATNRPLNELVEKGEFRADLFYRINVLPIHIPPLREREEDIAVLANHMLFEFNQTYNQNLRLSGAAIEVLEAYNFPGNIRELQNIIIRAAIKNDGEIIESFVIEHILMGNKPHQNGSDYTNTKIPSLKSALQQFEDDLILKAMKIYGSTTKAAEALGISQSSVSRKYQHINQKNQRNS